MAVCGDQHISFTEIPHKLCVEANDYYRRDNYRFLEKLQKVEMKKKGLLAQIPFNVQLENELSDDIDLYPATAVATPNYKASRNAMKYTAIASQREESSLKGRSIRNLFSRLDNLSRSRMG